MSTELATLDAKPLPLAPPVQDDQYIKPTFVILNQKMTQQEGAVFGKFYDQKTNENLDSIEIVPLNIRKKRVLYAKGGGFGATPICRSDDGVVPSKYAQFPQSPTCKGCPKFQWDGKTPPECDEGKELLFIVRDTGVPRKINFSKTSLKVANQLTDALFEACTVAKKKHQREVAELIAEGATPEQAERNALNKMQAICDFKVTIKPEVVPGAKGTYSTVTYGKLERLRTLGEFYQEYQTYVASPKAQRAQEAEDAQVDKAVDGVIEGEAVEV